MLAGHLPAQKWAAWQWACRLPLLWRPQLQRTSAVSSFFWKHDSGDMLWTLLKLSDRKYLVSVFGFNCRSSLAQVVAACSVCPPIVITGACLVAASLQCCNVLTYSCASPGTSTASSVVALDNIPSISEGLAASNVCTVHVMQQRQATQSCD